MTNHSQNKEGAMKMKPVISVVRVLVVLSLISAALGWAADVKYPTKPIHMWVGFAAGGSTDICARSASAIAERALGQPIVVENKPGGGGEKDANLARRSGE